MSTPGFGGAGRHADTVYDRTAPGAQTDPVYAAGQQASTYEQMLIQQARASVAAPAPYLRPQEPLPYAAQPVQRAPEPGAMDVLGLARGETDRSWMVSGQDTSFTVGGAPQLGLW